MKINKVVCGFFVVASAGCSTVGWDSEATVGNANSERFFQEAQTSLKSYQEMKTVFGLPHEQRSIVDERVVVWKNSTVAGGASRIQMDGSISSTPLLPLSCELTAVVNDDGSVSNVEMDGNNGACWFFSNKFVAWVDSKD